MLIMFEFSVLLLMAIFALAQLSLSSELVLKESILTPLESGFESLKASSLMSAPFFFLAILFVLFDLELVLLLPAVLAFSLNLFSCLLWVSTVVLILMTLLVEWSWCGLKWQV